MIYRIRPTSVTPPFTGTQLTGPWLDADTALVHSFRPESSEHRPHTEARLLYTADALHCLFTVDDRYVVCRHTHFNDMVCNDSCVEIFLQPAGADGYLNFECNCGGTLHASHITDWRRTSGGFAAFRHLSEDEGRTVTIAHTLPAVVDPEDPDAIRWAVQLAIPFALIARVTGTPQDVSGTAWRGNFYKCADQSSHPHWASWSPVDELNFHLPRCFSELHFEEMH
ncbi:MAG: hypothetical protein GF331_19885 [Chitinivibrionales bacterium]|nr:hypothetical protein [Chitinivibrionales bacterium]